MECNQFYCGDSRDLLRKLDSDSVDLVVTDVPYKVTSRGGGVR